MTEYVILRQQPVNEGEAFHIIGYENARSARSAIQQIIDSLDQTDGGQYVAVPSRSFKPVTVKVETKTALKFS